MRKIFFLLFLSIFCLGFSQKKKAVKAKTVAEKETVIIYTEEDAEKSSEPRIIAGFLKQNPGHAKSDRFKRKLMDIIMADNSPEAKPTIKPISKDKIAKIVSNNELNSGKDLATLAKNVKTDKNTNFASTGSKKSGASEEGKRTASMLTHLFSNDSSKSEAYVNIRNKSKCNLIVKISGKKYYNLDVPARGQNFVLIDKGEYVVTTAVCDAKYSSLKKITKDIEIELNVAD
ncbi:hypothetical protein ASG01_08405 [Chryseobacterium sp. Leaf180]|jgi:hypothetical protein|uniref:DUF6759 domain-containing protein n=1 Tax=Chryseobacterium sp. Leaf180 TaxID=1736289 RepID=UPI0006FB4E5D|nr:DUF6759 domain-containing protein [Chryseobacterium sp. Leaf180]KQR93870.1 hypothetical protein ASG01_08405 [Chryseobacterium sp. Leaf180]